MDFSKIFKLGEPYTSMLALDLPLSGTRRSVPVHPSSGPQADEKKEFAAYINARRGDMRFLEYDRDGAINYGAFLAHLCAEWDSGLPDSEADALYHRFLNLDMPFDAETRTRFPNVLAHAANLKDLIAPEIRDYLGVVSFYLLEGKARPDACLAALIGFAKSHYIKQPPSREEAIAMARDQLQKNHIAVSDFEALSEHVLAKCDEGDLPRAFLREIAHGHADELATELRAYRESLESPEHDRPNRYLIKLMDEMTLGLDYGYLKPAMVIDFLRPYHHSGNPEMRLYHTHSGLSYAEAKTFLRATPMQSHAIAS